MANSEVVFDVVSSDDIDSLKARLYAMESCLIWLREDIVNGNQNHVDKINRALGGN